MDSVVEQIMLKLPTSKTELSADNIKKIHRYLPVPSDYKILWAEADPAFYVLIMYANLFFCMNIALPLNTCAV